MMNPLVQFLVDNAVLCGFLVVIVPTGLAAYLYWRHLRRGGESNPTLDGSDGSWVMFLGPDD